MLELGGAGTARPSQRKEQALRITLGIGRRRIAGMIVPLAAALGIAAGSGVERLLPELVPPGQVRSQWSSPIPRKHRDRPQHRPLPIGTAEPRLDVPRVSRISPPSG